MRKPLLLVLLLASAGVSASILPLIHDRPRRDNPYDPTNKPMELPMAPAWTPTPTNTATPSCNSLTDTASVSTFESAPHGFVFETYSSGSTVYQSGTFVLGTPACNGSQALCGTVAWTHGGIDAKVAYKKTGLPSLNWTGKTLSVWVYFPPAAGPNLTARLYVKCTGGYNGTYGADTLAGSSGGWKILSYNVAAVANINDVREFGVDMYSVPGNPDGPFTICVDSFNVQ